MFCLLFSYAVASANAEWAYKYLNVRMGPTEMEPIGHNDGLNALNSLVLQIMHYNFFMKIFTVCQAAVTGLCSGWAGPVHRKRLLAPW